MGVRWNVQTLGPNKAAPVIRSIRECGADAAKRPRTIMLYGILWTCSLAHLEEGSRDAEL